MLVLFFIFVSPGRKRPVRPSGIPRGITGKRFITASTWWNKNLAPWQGRLHQRAFGGGWAAKKNNRRQFLQFDLRRPFEVVKVSTQGLYILKQWVKSFYISYSQDKYRWRPYMQYGRVKVRRARIFLYSSILESFFFWSCLFQSIIP